MRLVPGDSESASLTVRLSGLSIRRLISHRPPGAPPDPAGHQVGHGGELVLCLQVLGEAPGHHGCVAWVVDVLLAGRRAVAGVVPPDEASF